MEAEQFHELIQKLEKLADDLTKKRQSYKKEPKRRLKNVDRLQEWLESAQRTWLELEEGNETALEQEELLKETNYYKTKRFAKAQLEYDDMTSNIKFNMGVNASFDNNEEREEEINEDDLIEIGDDNDHENIEEFKTPRSAHRRVTIQYNDENEESDTPARSEQKKVTKQIEEVFKTPRHLMYPDYVCKNDQLVKKVDDAIDRFNYKLKKFSRALDIIEDYVKSDLRGAAKEGLIDLDKINDDLNEKMDEIAFMIGDAADEYQATYDTLIFRHRQLKNELNKKMQINTKSGVQPAALKLRPIEIPTFSGSFKTWPTFSGLFKTMIINNSALDNIQKMSYLKTSVSGEAAKLIANIDVTAENFEKAWKLLIERFENKRAIRNTHMELLLKLPDMKVENTGELREHLDKTKECMELLNDMSGEQVFLYLLMKKLPEETRKIYEQSRENPREEQQMSEYVSFLQKRCEVLEAIGSSYRKNEKVFKQPERRAFIDKCVCCDENHAIYSCNKFRNMTVYDRRDLAKKKLLCLLCLKPKHQANECKFQKMCPQCNMRHNGLLHFDANGKVEKRTEKTLNKDHNKKSYVATTEVVNTVCATARDEATVGALLATAQIRIKTNSGWSETIRVLVDQGSMNSFITERTVKSLKLEKSNNKINICGIAGSVEAASGTVQMQISARYPTSFRANVNAIILKKLTSLLPGSSFNKSLVNRDELADLIMADPDFNKQGRIDMILGADVYTELILNGMIKAHDKSFVAQETEIGWVISGPIFKQKTEEIICMVASLEEIDERLQCFWELEEINGEKIWKPEEQECMEHFENTIARDEDGKYVVSLPFKKNASLLGNSKRMAAAQFFQLEKKFGRQPELKTAYVKYIDELIENGYMKIAQNDDNEPHCYLPQHPVFKESSTTQVRPVFNASQKTSNGIALNDMLLTGPKLQENLFDIMLRFRSHKIAFTADIAKMYLHIKLNENDQRFQKIFWRENESEPLREYCLTTVTFGINSSPCLAVATVQHHAKNRSNKYPDACKIILEDSYMDDVSSGCESVEKAIKLRREICKVLAEADFPLRKWMSNSEQLLETIPIELRETAKTMGMDDYVSTLGLKWFFNMDKLGFKLNMKMDNTKLTKRSILSQITSIFDPLGLLSPITIYNKIIMQEIWREQSGWDDKVSERTKKKWNAFVQEASLIEKIRVQRWLEYKPSNKIELHGFSDASEAAMGACIYMKTYENGTIYTNLIAAKTKVAPTKKITLPKLELCAAVLLAKLVHVVKRALRLENVTTKCYSDSEITLAWIQKDASSWKTFVANRVARIQELTKAEDWNYINTKANPADLASRGTLPSELIDNKLWWYGPSVLLNEDNIVIKQEKFETQLDEKKTKTTALHLKLDVEAISRFSNIHRAINSIAYCKRFIGRLKNKNKSNNVLTKEEAKKEAQKQNLSIEELNEAKLTLIKLFQNKHFGKDIKKLQEENTLPKDSKLKSLYPFLDEKGVLRVGGRLQNSEFSYEKKHPIIIPYACHLTELIIWDAHKQTLHGGNQLTLCQIRHEYWIISAKRAVKAALRQCIRCHRFKSQQSTQLMGNLPAVRTKMVEKAFTNTGTDLCGPVFLRMMSGRGIKTQKGYIVIFICMSTRAIHIELVTDLTSEAFIAAFKRLIGRRGNVLNLYCDNGTNFIGAKKILMLESEQAMLDFNTDIQKTLATHNTDFHFNPALSPWMGGLWERGVGSIKYHLKRTIADRILTYEELSTVLIQIEAILNSRPITPLTENPDDLDILTPGHFLVGNALTAPMEPSVLNLKQNQLSNWQMISRMRQEFWEKWSNDFISNLQIRSKWMEASDNVKIGDMVLLKEENTAPLAWPLGRIKQVYPGKDGLVRVVEVMAKGKVYKRPLLKIAKLPISHQQNRNESMIKTATAEEKSSDKKQVKTSTKRIETKCMFATATTTRKSHKIATGVKLCVMLSICIFFGCFVGVANGHNAYDLEHFDEHKNVFVKKLGSGAIVNGHWNLVTYMNLAEYEEEYDILHKNIGILRENCKNTTCGTVMQEIDSWSDDITTYNALIKMKFGSPQKRSWGGFFSALLGSLVGMIGEKVLQHITGDDSDNKKQEILSQQVSIIKLAHEQMMLMENTTNSIEVIQWNMSYVLLALIKYHNKQKLILNTISNGKTELSAEWLRPDELQYQITLMMQHLPSDVMLIGGNDHEKLLAVYKLAKIKTILTPHTIISIIKIPLISKERFEHNQIIALPFEHGGKFIAPVIRNEHVWKNEKLTKLFSTTELNKCIQYEDELYCDITEPFMAHDSIRACEWQLFENKTTSSCEYKTAENDEYWVRIHGNDWLFSTRNNTAVRVKCESEEKEIKIHGVGKLSFRENCEMTTMNVALRSIKDMMTNGNRAKHSQVHKIVWPVKLNATAFNEKIMKTINELESKDGLFMMHHWHHYIMIYITIIVTMFTVSYFYSKLELAPVP